MDVRERIRRARLIEKISEHAEYAERIGIIVSTAEGPNPRMVVNTDKSSLENNLRRNFHE